MKDQLVRKFVRMYACDIDIVVYSDVSMARKSYVHNC